MLTIRALTVTEYAEFEAAIVDFYAEQSVRAGRVPADGAQEWSRAETRTALPKGLDTPPNWIYVIETDGPEKAGYVWCGRHPDDETKSHLYAIVVFESFRNRGVGTRALELPRTSSGGRASEASAFMSTRSTNKPFTCTASPGIRSRPWS